MKIELEISAEDLKRLTEIAILNEDSGNISLAISLYKIGIEFNDLTCMTRLADILSEPPDFIDVPLAEELYLKACVAGHAPGCRNLAILYKQLGRSALHDRYMKLAKSRGDVWQNDD